MSISKQVRDYVNNHPQIKNCLKAGIINYSSLSRRILEDASIDGKNFDAVLIAVRRIAESYSGKAGEDSKIIRLVKNGKFEFRTKVSSVVLDDSLSFEKLALFWENSLKKPDNFHLIQGTKTITVILDDSHAQGIKKSFRPYVVDFKHGLVQITHKTSEKVESTPGFLNYLTSLFAENGINIFEAMSSWTDSIFLISSGDAEKAFSIFAGKKTNENI
jgi:hypothetical protein